MTSSKSLQIKTLARQEFHRHSIFWSVLSSICRDGKRNRLVLFSDLGCKAEIAYLVL